MSGGCTPKEAARLWRSPAVLFTDLASAFNSALPELALGLSSRKGKSSTVWGVGCEQRARLEEWISSEETTVRRQEVAARWRRMAADFHRHPWFGGARFAEADAHLCRYSAGRPSGRRCVCLHTQKNLEEYLAQVGARVRLARRLGGIFGMGDLVEETLPDPTYVDDLAVLLGADSHPEFLARQATFTEGAVRITLGFGPSARAGAWQDGSGGELGWPLDPGLCEGFLRYSPPVDRSRCSRTGRVWVKAASCGSRELIRRCGSCKRAATWGQSRRLGLAWGRSFAACAVATSPWQRWGFLSMFESRCQGLRVDTMLASSRNGLRSPDFRVSTAERCIEQTLARQCLCSLATALF